jgi:hypothetical protein
MSAEKTSYQFDQCFPRRNLSASSSHLKGSGSFRAFCQEHWFALGSAVLIVLILGKAWLFFTTGQPPLFRDSLGYWRLAEQMAGGDWLMLENASAFRVPGCPAFLAVCQGCFGPWALVAVTGIQQIFVVLVALITAWICWRITGSKSAVLIALALSLVCIARCYIGLYPLSDNLLCLLLSILFAFFVIWFQRPALGWAAVIGFILGLCILTRPVMQLAWAPLLLGMALRLGELGPWRKLWKHALCLLTPMVLVVGPWLLRNEYCFGRFFLTKSMGRQLWDSCFVGNNNGRLMNPAMDFAEEGPATQEVFAALRGRDPNFAEYLRDYMTDNFNALMELGYSEVEADDLMRTVAIEAIRAHPVKFALTRSYRCLIFWINSEENFHWYYRNADRAEVATHFTLKADEEPSSYEGQRAWYLPAPADLLNALTSCLWFPSRWVYAVAFGALVWSLINLISRPPWRTLGMAIALLLLYFTAVTSIPAQPMYRYRMVLEPIMIVVVSAAIVTAKKSSNSNTSERIRATG